MVMPFIRNEEDSRRKRSGADVAMKRKSLGTSLAVQWLRVHAPNTEGTGLVPGRETKIPHAAWYGLNKMKNLVLDPSEA